MLVDPARELQFPVVLDAYVDDPALEHRARQQDVASIGQPS